MDKNIDYQLDAVSDEVASSFSMVENKGGTVLGSTMRDMAGSIATIPILPPDPETAGEYLLVDRVQSSGSAAAVWQNKSALIHDATLTITSNGSAIGTFRANASVDKAIDIAVPTSVSQLNNDTGFQTQAEVASSVAEASSALADRISLKQDRMSVVSGGRLALSPESVLSFNESGLASEAYVDDSVSAASACLSSVISSASAALSERINTKQDVLVPVPDGGILISEGRNISVDPDFFPLGSYVTLSQLDDALGLKQDKLTVSGGRLALSPESVLSFDESGLASESYVDASVSSASSVLNGAISAASAALSVRIDSKQDIISAGTGIVINGGTVISAAAATAQSAGIVRPDNSTVYLNESGDLAADTLPRYPGSNTELGMLYAEPGSAAQWIPSPDLKDPGKPFFGYFRIMTSDGVTVEVPNISALGGLTNAKIGDIVSVDDVGLDYRRGVPFVRTELDGDSEGARFPEAPGWSLFETMTVREAEDVIHTSGFVSRNDPKGAMLVYDPDANPLLRSSFRGAWRVTAPEDLGLKLNYVKRKFFFPSIDDKTNTFSWDIGMHHSLEALHVFRNGLLLLDGVDEDYIYTESEVAILITFTASAGLVDGDKYLAEAWYY